jgi:hypothetical protein
MKSIRDNKALTSLIQSGTLNEIRNPIALQQGIASDFLINMDIGGGNGR